MAGHNKALTLVELLLVILFLGAFATIAIPKLNFAAISRKKVDVTARKIVTDLRRTRMLAISNAVDNTQGFALNISGSTYEIENLATSETVDSHTIDSDVSCSGGTQFQFGPLGNLLTESTSLDVSGQDKTYTITIVSATGSVKCAEN